MKWVVTSGNVQSVDLGNQVVLIPGELLTVAGHFPVAYILVRYHCITGITMVIPTLWRPDFQYTISRKPTELIH